MIRMVKLLSVAMTMSVALSLNAEKYKVIKIAPDNAVITIADKVVSSGDVFDSDAVIEWSSQPERQGMIVSQCSNPNIRYTLSKEKCSQQTREKQSLSLLIRNNIVSLGKASVRGVDGSTFLVAMGEDVVFELSEAPMGVLCLRYNGQSIANELRVEGKNVVLPNSLLSQYEGVHNFQLVEVVDGEDENRYNLEVEVIGTMLPDKIFPLTGINQTMGKYYMACRYLAKSVAETKVDWDNLDMSMFLYTETFYSVSDLPLIPVDTMFVMPLAGHFCYGYPYAKTIYMSGIDVDQGNNRHDEIFSQLEGECRVKHLRLRAGATCTYRVPIGMVKSTFLVLAEPKHAINVKVWGDDACFLVYSYERNTTALCQYNSMRDEYITLTITNCSNEPTALCIMAD